MFGGSALSKSLPPLLLLLLLTVLTVGHLTPLVVVSRNRLLDDSAPPVEAEKGRGIKEGGETSTPEEGGVPPVTDAKEVEHDGNGSSESFVETRTCLGLATFFGVCSIMISLSNIFVHLVHHNIPSQQRYVVRLLLFVPVYALGSLLILMFINYFLYFEAIRDIWEAVVVYSFFALISDYCGGENACAVEIAGYPGSINHPFPIPLIAKHLCRFAICQPLQQRLIYPIPLNLTFLKTCKRCVLQFILLKPFVAIVSILMYSVGLYQHGGIYWVCLSVVYNISVSIALYALFLFYIATRHHSKLVGKRPVRKFAAIKLVIIATWYQGFVLGLVPGFDIIHATKWNNVLLCLEMPVFAILNALAYPISEFMSRDNTTVTTITLDQSLSHIPSLYGKEGGKAEAVSLEFDEYDEDDMDDELVSRWNETDGRVMVGGVVVGEGVQPSGGGRDERGNFPQNSDIPVFLSRSVAATGQAIKGLNDEKHISQTGVTADAEPKKWEGRRADKHGAAIAHHRGFLSEGESGPTAERVGWTGRELVDQNEVRTGTAEDEHDVAITAGECRRNQNPTDMVNGVSRNVPDPKQRRLSHQLVGVGNGRRNFDLMDAASGSYGSNCMHANNAPTATVVGCSRRATESSEVAERAISNSSGSGKSSRSTAGRSSSINNSDSSSSSSGAVGGFGDSLRSPIRLLTNAIRDKRSHEKALRNACDAVLMTDVVTDAYYNFNARYHSHALLIDSASDDDKTDTHQAGDTMPNVNPADVESCKP